MDSISKEKLGDDVKSLTLIVSCDDKDGNDVEIPLVKYKLK